jgi:hypothetical protein
MKSKRSAKNTGGATPLPQNSTAISPELSEISPSCVYRSKTGHRCHMLAFDPDSPFCPFHARENLKRQRRELSARARLLLGTMRQFPTPEHVQCLLGNLITQLAFGRVDRKDALALAYVSQLLLQTFPAVQRSHEEEHDGILSKSLTDALNQAASQVAATQHRG